MLQVYTLILLELLGYPVNNALVKVVATEMGIAVGGLDLEYTIAYLKNGYVEGPTAKVVDGYCLLSLLVQAICQRCGGRLVYYPEDFQAGDASCVLGGVALAVVEIRRNGYDRLCNFLA